ncbi:flagellar hook-associated protein FlgK [Marinobacterium iners]|jgi:flagellar hook-associated protein 1 FlgK|uniref:flagellar hook-associated protein FlgK n=1 Tax=Marinobacterium TaxID=48075 RepID=UPI001A90039E|nr:flagellar hook-associated protein FlgK [Marinobacterium iners]QSR33870.1 flagellar hook-associated protein FlgK [Marinobacterium iners]
MSSSILNIGVQALNANQTALSYVGQNIANVNTDGYSRQTIQMGTQDPPILGVAVKDIKRMTDQFLIRQVWADTSFYKSNEAYSAKITQLDSMLVSDSTSLSSSMDSYFSSLQQVVDDPLFIANRELFLAEAASLANSFNDFDSKLRTQSELVNTEIRSMVQTVNAITENIAALNVQIGTLQASGQNANELQDKRDLLVKELSGYVTTSVIADQGDSYNVMIGTGQPLVVGSSAAKLEVGISAEDPTQLAIWMTNRSGTRSLVTDQLGNGAIGGLVNYRDNVLQPTLNEVGRMAIVFSETMNEQHRKGMDLNGDMGNDLFTPFRQGEVTAHAENQNQDTSANVGFYDVKALTGSDYRFEVTGIDTFRITRLSDGQRFESANMDELLVANGLDQSGTFYRDSANDRLSVSLDGVTFTLAGDAGIGDSYLIQPTRSGGRLMGTEITNPRLLALASPLRVEPASTNTGNAELANISLTSSLPTSNLRTGNAELPLEIVFNAPDADGNITYSVYSNVASGMPEIYESMENLVYVEGEPIVIARDDYELTFNNQPNPGDRFTIEFNTDGYSDNSNALAMSDLQSQTLVNGFSYQDTYGQLLAKVGTQASSANISFASSKSVLTASENALQSVAGVNLDEEAANLVKYQQAYSAAAQLISTYQSIFDSLIGAVRR